MSKKRRSVKQVVATVFVVTTLFALSAPVQAVNKEGAKCTRAGAVVRVAGKKLAVEVGLTKPSKNVFFDFGVYDMRSSNKISSDSTWAAQHLGDKEMSWHAVCWFDLFDAQSAATVRSLPSRDGASGKTSDYCN
ncbi:MAG: hypothetical protein ACYC06_07605 [Ilumatobacteraceae bacterium]